MYDQGIRTIKVLCMSIMAGTILAQAATVSIYPGTDIPSVVGGSPAGTSFVIYPGG